MVLEWGHKLVPAWQILAHAHGHKLGQPGNVLDLLFLESEVGVEATVVELLLEGHREAARLLLCDHHVCQQKECKLETIQ